MGIYLDRFDLCNNLFKVCIVGLKDKLQFGVISHLPLRAEWKSWRASWWVSSWCTWWDRAGPGPHHCPAEPPPPSSPPSRSPQTLRGFCGKPEDVWGCRSLGPGAMCRIALVSFSLTALPGWSLVKAHQGEAWLSPDAYSRNNWSWWLWPDLNV